MKKIIIYGILFIMISSFGFATMDPEWKECMQRGYKVVDSNCIFPDDTSCSIEEFNSGVCGEAFMTKNYCIKAGDPIWDKKCCEGLNPYPIGNIDGGKTCKKLTKSEQIQLAMSKSVYFFVAIVVFFFIFIGIGIWRIMRKMEQ